MAFIDYIIIETNTPSNLRLHLHFRIVEKVHVVDMKQGITRTYQTFESQNCWSSEPFFPIPMTHLLLTSNLTKRCSDQIRVV